MDQVVVAVPLGIIHLKLEAQALLVKAMQVVKALTSPVFGKGVAVAAVLVLWDKMAQKLNQAARVKLALVELGFLLQLLDPP